MCIRDRLQTTFRSNLILCIASAAAGYWLYRMTGYVFFQYPLLSIVSPDFNRIFLAVWLAGCVLSCIFSYKDVRAMRRYIDVYKRQGHNKPLAGYIGKKRFYCPQDDGGKPPRRQYPDNGERLSLIHIKPW